MTGYAARLPLLRGSAEGALCEECPFSTNGMPTRPVYSEFPEDPAWLVIGEGPGHNEVRWQRPFVGPSGEVLNQILTRIGRARDELYVGNATLCIPPQGTPEIIRERAAACCRPRMLAELASFPGKPVLTLGAVAARSLIPQAVLDAIDPPDTARIVRKAQKLRQAPTLKAELARRKAITKASEKRLAKMIDHRRKQLKADAKRLRRRPDEAYLEREILRDQPRMALKAREDAIKEVDLKARERAIKKLVDASKPKPKKKKPKRVKITDIVGTLFDVDVDGSGERPVIPGIHPAALLRGGGASIAGSHSPDLVFINLIYDAGKVNSLAKGKDIRLKLDVEIEFRDSARVAELFMQFYHDAIEEGAFSLDLETYVDDPNRHSALMAYVAKIRVIGLATKRGAISLAWDLIPSWCLSLLQLLLANEAIMATYHNGLYDRTVLRANGFAVEHSYDDTMLMHHAAFPGNSHKLQVVAGQFYGVPPWKSEFRNQEETLETLTVYNAKDTGATHALRKPLQIHVKRREVERVYDLDRKMADVASHMHLAGMPVDRDTNSELLATFSRNVSESRRAVEDIAQDKRNRELIWHHLAIQQAGKQRKLDPSDFEERYNLRLSAMKLDPDWKWKIGAGKHIAALLLAMGVALTAKTAGGDVSTNKEVLESLTDVPVVRDILTYRENDKLLSTFIWAIFDRFDKNGEIIQYGYADHLDRIHPIWNVHRISGRWASQWPVVSNVPKDKWKKLTHEEVAALSPAIIAQLMENPGKPTLVGATYLRFAAKDKSISKMVRPNLRRQIRAPKGRKFVGFDFAQIEARVIALISGDPFLCAVFADPTRDIHIECARAIWEFFDTLDKDTQKQLRENVKNIEYGYMYMAQLETLHKTMLKAGNLIKLADLAKAIERLAKLMPGIKAWQQQAIQRAMMPPHEIRDFVLGRSRVWPMGNAEPPEAVNIGVQTAGASIVNTGLARMWPHIYSRNGAHRYRQVDPIGHFHDALIFECWEDDAERLAIRTQLEFETSFERAGVRIPFTIDVKIGDTWAEV